MVFSGSKKLLYSSRAPIPASKKDVFKEAYKHICVYAFNKKHLENFKKVSRKTKFELIEDLEINRFLELDIPVSCIELDCGGKAVDTSHLMNKLKAETSNYKKTIN